MIVKADTGDQTVLAEALSLQYEAAAQGFDWRNADELWEKLQEEVVELQEAVTQGPERIEDELGDLLFMAVNLSRHLGCDPVSALTRANSKFRNRFGHVLSERGRWQGLEGQARLEAMERLWQDAKQSERG